MRIFRTVGRVLLPMAMVALVPVLAQPANAAPGDLDPSFDSDGTVTTSIGSGDDLADDVAIQSDGKIVVVGQSYGSGFALVRYTSSGALDPTFGTGGKVTTAIGSASAAAHSVAIQPDGKIVAAGYSSNGSNLDFTVVRYTKSGALDESFGGTGAVVTPIGSSEDIAKGVAIQADGKIVAGGQSIIGSINAKYNFAVVRYTSLGALDPTFGTGGKVTTSFGSANGQANALAIQESDGKIVAVGHTDTGGSEQFAVVRYASDGTLDPTFGGTGQVTTSIGTSDLANDTAIQSDGKIVAAGYSVISGIHRFALVRYASDGTLDTTFGGTGKITTPIGFFAEAYGVAIQVDGKIVAAGRSESGGKNDFAVVRYAPDGTLDTTFGGTGKVTTAIGSSIDQARAVAIQADGKIVAAGYTFDGPNTDIALARYLTSPAALSIADVRVIEGDTGTTPAQFTVSVALPGTKASTDITVHYATGSDTATSADYVGRSGTLTFSPGEISKTVDVSIRGDLIDESNEVFYVRLSSPQGAVIQNGTAEGTIDDDDATPSISVGDVTVTEGNTGTTLAVFTLALSNPKSEPVSVDFLTADKTAAAPTDYQSKSGTKVFWAGQTTKSVAVPVNGDTTQEPDEQFYLRLQDAEGATIATGQALGNILDDDRPKISINNVSKTEGTAGNNQTYSFTVSLNKAGTSPITVHYATFNASAIAPGDFTAKSGTLTFSVGQLTKSVAITVKGDNVIEPTEFFYVNLDSPTNATILDSQGVGTIVTDEPQ